MNIKSMLADVEAEIAKLQRVADALRGTASKRGRPRGVRILSAAARKKISLAQKARWAKQKGKS